jgi:hypothetical protein
LCDFTIFSLTLDRPIDIDPPWQEEQAWNQQIQGLGATVDNG